MNTRKSKNQKPVTPIYGSNSEIENEASPTGKVISAKKPSFTHSSDFDLGAFFASASKISTPAIPVHKEIETKDIFTEYLPSPKTSIFMTGNEDKTNLSTYAYILSVKSNKQFSTLIRNCINLYNSENKTDSENITSLENTTPHLTLLDAGHNPNLDTLLGSPELKNSIMKDVEELFKKNRLDTIQLKPKKLSAFGRKRNVLAMELEEINNRKGALTSIYKQLIKLLADKYQINIPLDYPYKFLPHITVGIAYDSLYDDSVAKLTSLLINSDIILTLEKCELSLKIGWHFSKKTEILHSIKFGNSNFVLDEKIGVVPSKPSHSLPTTNNFFLPEPKLTMSEKEKIKMESDLNEKLVYSEPKPIMSEKEKIKMASDLNEKLVYNENLLEMYNLDLEQNKKGPYGIFSMWDNILTSEKIQRAQEEIDTIRLKLRDLSKSPSFKVDL